MIRVTLWYEYLQESGEMPWELIPDELWKKYGRAQLEGLAAGLGANSCEIKNMYPLGVMGTLAAYLEKCEDMEITSVNMYMPEYGLSDELLEHTDVLVWWAHTAHEIIPDALSKKIKERVLKGMGFIPLHSAHQSKPFMDILGCSGTLRWREGDFCRVWNINPTHPIALGIPEYIELEKEEMYGEYFDIPKPDDIVFVSWFAGGEIFRGGCTWTRGYGKIFYFHPGHETNPSYHNPLVLKIIENAIRWAKPTCWRKNLDCTGIPEPMKRE